MGGLEVGGLEGWKVGGLKGRRSTRRKGQTKVCGCSADVAVSECVCLYVWGVGDGRWEMGHGYEVEWMLELVLVYAMNGKGMPIPRSLKSGRGYETSNN